ncbi:hypothetical protein HAX44_13410 [Enterococcus faecalis]|uniref:hypothetical protein n=1 Tax=Enterococcus faecalis TaxID=1351 RepID=UPI001883F8E9|nr:hypothetical protein [Enterococcus faecalis]MBF0006606.1 hypothetical protein [Enterococcus faecalis]MBF0009289.1 hypothetical protein [Enterococcus faecalis]MBF0018471.1 hypothetical protein [Enterococcus faecalis]
MYSYIAIFLFLFVFCLFRVYQPVKSKRVISYFMNETNQAQLLKQCYYDQSFRQETLDQLRKIKQRLKYQMEEEIHKQIKLNVQLNDGGEHFLLWSFQYEQLEELQEKIINDEYVKELMILDPTERHLDDWDLF